MPFVVDVLVNEFLDLRVRVLHYFLPFFLGDFCLPVPWHTRHFSYPEFPPVLRRLTLIVCFAFAIEINLS